MLNFRNRSNYIVSKHPKLCSISLNPDHVSQHAVTSYQITNTIYKTIQHNRALPNLVKARLAHQAFKFEPFIKSQFTISPIDIWQMPTYVKVANFIDTKKIQDTKWYKNLRDELSVLGVARHKNIRLHTNTEIKDFLQYYRREVVDSLRIKGFKNDIKMMDMPTVLLSENGSIIKGSKGNHRFAIAKIVGLDHFPVVICGIHGSYFRKNQTSKRSIAHNLTHIRAKLVS
jgi:hypothetical protein